MSFSFDSNSELKKSFQSLEVLEKINLITEGATLAFNAMECSSLAKAYKILDGNWKEGRSNFPTSGIISNLMGSIKKNTKIDPSKIHCSYEKRIVEDSCYTDTSKINFIHVYIKFSL